MKAPQVVVYETDGRIAGYIRNVVSERRWLLRESRQLDACFNLLVESRPNLLVLKLDRELLSGLELLQKLKTIVPDCATIMVSDVKMEGSDNRDQLTALAFDLGARFVLFPPIQQPILEDLVVGLMTSTIARTMNISENAIES